MSIEQVAYSISQETRGVSERRIDVVDVRVQAVAERSARLGDPGGHEQPDDDHHSEPHLAHHLLRLRPASVR